MNLFLDVQCPFSKGTLHCFVVKLVVREQPNRCTCVTAIEDYTDRSQKSDCKEENGKVCWPFHILSVGGKSQDLESRPGLVVGVNERGGGY